MKTPAMLTRAQVSREIAQALAVTLRDGEALLEEILSSMVRALRQGDRIELRGFGVFWVHQRGGRVGRNPMTGAPVQVPPKKVVHFKANKEILRVLNCQSTDKTPTGNEGNPAPERAGYDLD
jgi:nucleoid DNA-binding protein